MNKGAFMSNNMDKIKEDYPDIYDTLVNLNDNAYNPRALDEKTLKLIAIGIVASTSNDIAIYKQMKNSIDEYNVSKDEIIDVLNIVLLISGKPAYTKAVGILYSLFEE